MEHVPQTVPSQRPEVLVGALHRLLEGQIACARQGNLARVEELAEQASAIVTKLANERDSEGMIRDSGVEKLYRELALVLTAEKDDVQDKLKRLRQVKRAIGVYHGGVERL